MSVIIPTYNNRRVLRQTIAALLAQDFPPGAYEVIIADDGSTDGTAEMVQAVRGPVPVRYVPQRNRSRAAARNLGTRQARGRILMFLDSDLWAAPVLLAEHYKHYATASRRVGVKGRSITHPDARGSLFMQVKEMGPDLTVQRTSDLSPFHVTSRNLSVRRGDFEEAGGFDEAFGGYGWEDMELAMRLRAAGVVFEYEPLALGFHYHAETLEGNVRKLREAGEGAVYFWRKHRRSRHIGMFLEIAPAILPLKWLVYHTPLITPLVRATLPAAEARRWRLILAECYNHLIWRAYYDGVFRALRHRFPAAAAAQQRGEGPAQTAP